MISIESIQTGTGQDMGSNNKFRKYQDKKSWIFDLAVLTVQNPFRLNEYVSPVCLPSQNFTIVNGIGVISGFGLTQVRFQNDET